MTVNHNQSTAPTSRQRTSVLFVATAWGSKEGGINVFNKLMCDALNRSYGDTAEVVCAVPATGEHKACVENGTQLFEHDCPKQLFSEADVVQFTESYLRSHRRPDWIVGHDAITGGLALALGAKFGCRVAIVHHMNYQAYSIMKSADVFDTRSKKLAQEKILCDCDLVFAVGPKLRDSALDKIRGSSRAGAVVELIPGIDGVDSIPAPNSFQAIALGRLGASDEVIKQSRLAVRGFAKFVTANNQPVDSTLLLYGALTGNETETDRIEVQKATLRDCQEHEQKLINVQLLPYSEDNEHLRELQRSSVCIVPSLHEGFGLVAWEALQASVPLIISTNSGVWQFLEESLGRFAKKNVRMVTVDGSLDEPTQGDIDQIAAHLAEIASDSAGEKICAEELKRALLRRGFTALAFALKIATALGIASQDEAPQDAPLLDPRNFPMPHTNLIPVSEPNPAVADSSETDPVELELNSLREAILAGEINYPRRRLGEIQSQTPRTDIRFRCLSTIGLSYFVEESFQEASQFLLEAYNLSPEKVNAQTNAALAYLIVEQPHKALEICDLLLAREPENGVAQERKLSALLQISKTEAAKYYDAVQNRTPSFELVAQLQLHDDSERKISELRTFVAEDGKREPTFLLLLASSLQEKVRAAVRRLGYKRVVATQEELDEAYNLCCEVMSIREKGTAANPQYLRALKLRASISLKRGHFEDAADDCAKLLELVPEDSDVLRLQVITRFCLKDYSATVAACERYQTLENSLVEPYVVSLAETGHLERAARYLEPR